MNASAWSILTSFDDDGAIDTISVTRVDGLPFEHDLSCVADHVRAWAKERGISVGNQSPGFVKNKTVCVIRG